MALILTSGKLYFCYLRLLGRFLDRTLESGCKKRFLIFADTGGIWPSLKQAGLKSSTLFPRVNSDCSKIFWLSRCWYSFADQADAHEPVMSCGCHTFRVYPGSELIFARLIVEIMDSIKWSGHMLGWLRILIRVTGQLESFPLALRIHLKSICGRNSAI